MKENSKKINLGIVIPCHNEERSILKIITELELNLSPFTKEVEIKYLLIDDGSTDKTWSVIKNISNSFPNIVGIKLSTNFGHQIALLAGLEKSLETSDYVLSMDADLQHPPNIAAKMIRLILDQPIDIINAKQSIHSKKSLGLFKRLSSICYYKLLNSMGSKIESNVGDFRLMSANATLALVNHNDLEFFARGLISKLGFTQLTISYDVGQRFAGSTKYSLKKMFRLAFQGITSTSTLPLRLTFLLSIILLLICIGMIITVFLTWLDAKVVPGWTSIIISIYFLFGINFLILGIIGEYIGKTYRQVLGRPRYIIEEIISKPLNK